MIRGKKVIGIIGGMGPLATADLFTKIIQNTVASCDQEHLHVLIDNNTSIPDRTESILAGSDAPLPYLTESAKRLMDQGADLLVMACNTAHYFHARVADSVRIPVLNMSEITASYCSARGFTRVALLATTGTYRTEIYDPYFREKGIRMLRPSLEGIQDLMHLIYDEVKAGNEAHPERFEGELLRLKELGAEAYILACTELPLLFRDSYQNVPFLDSTLLLAREAVRRAGGQLISES